MRVTIAQNNFTAGEISPRLHGRVDIDRYGNAVKRMENAYTVVHGGFRRRAGTRYFRGTKLNPKTNRLIPFVFSRDAAYMLEFGDLYVRVHKAGGTYTGVELVTPYSEAMLDDIDFAQGADTMFLFHPAVQIYRFRRFSDTYFDLSAAPFTTTPFAEQGYVSSGLVGGALTLSASTVGAGRTATAASPIFLATDVGRNLLCEAGLANIVGFTSATVVTVNIVIAFSSTVLTAGLWSVDISPQTTLTPGAAGPIGTSTTMTLSAAGWRTTDVGSYIRVNAGLAKITGFTSSTVVQATILKELSGVVASPPLAWSLEDSVWSPNYGYPRTGTLHEQRLVVAGSTKYPQTIWGSRIAEYLDFTIGTDDDEAYSFTIAADEVNPISFMASSKNLLAHTYGGEFSLKGGVEKPITPTNVTIKPETPYGSKGVRPILVGKESVFVQRSGRKVRSMGFSFDVDGFKSPDISVLAEHITAPGGITAMTYQQEPDLLIWAIRADGGLLSCTFDRDQTVTAWAQHYTQGAFESVACIPNGDTDEVWVTVRRTVNGSTVRYVEILDDSFEPFITTPDPLAYPPIDPPIVYGYTVDSGIAANLSGGVSMAVNHLIGQTVDVVADGAVMGPQTVPPSGLVAFDRPVQRALVGLHFSSRVDQLTPEVGGGAGTAQGNNMRTSQLTLRFLETLGATVYDGDGDLVEELSFRQFGPDVLDTMPAPFTGLMRAMKLGWERGKDEISIRQDLPLPMHVLSSIRVFTVNEG